jgi:AbrB family looped-hinge helix DNA binding protein
MNAVTKVSAKGQVVIPKDVRDRLNWPQGTELEVIAGPGGVTLRGKKKLVDMAEFDRKLAELRAIVNYSGPKVTDAEANAAIDEMFRNDPKWDPPKR